MNMSVMREIAGHTSIRTTAGYITIGADAKQIAAEMVGNRIEKLLET